MPITGTSIATQAFAGLISKIPTVVSAVRADSTFGIPVHNPMAKMMTYCSKAWVSVITTTIVSNTYTGVAAGSAVAAPALITFPAAYAAGAQLIGFPNTVLRIPENLVLAWFLACLCAIRGSIWKVFILYWATSSE